MSTIFWSLFTGLALSVVMQGLGLACLYLSSGSTGYVVLQAIALQLWFIDRYSVVASGLLNAYFLYSLDRQQKAAHDDCKAFLAKSE